MRITKNIESIDYQETQRFFQNRAKKYTNETPYVVTMYQDEHPELTNQRNKHEVGKLMPLLNINKQSRILDLACGIGRWAEQISYDIDRYCGIDFAENLINIAKERTGNNEKKKFYTGSLTQISNLFSCHTFNCFLLIGALMYLNDNDVNIVLNQIENLCERHGIICIREPIAFSER